MFEDRAVTFPCHDDWLIGIASVPRTLRSDRGLVILVGGPQYRAGSHRHFTLLARHLAESGVPVFRFDYRGMGDSGGETRRFDEAGDDLRAAIDAFFALVPGLREVAIWGLCDGASGAACYAPTDSRVTGLALLNPWVRTETGAARAYLKHYYLARLFSPSAWLGVLRGGAGFWRPVRSIFAQLQLAVRRPPLASGHPNPSHARALPELMRDSLALFKGDLLLILSGNDLTAREFEDAVQACRKWRRLMNARRVRKVSIADANHTFASEDWRKRVELETMDWLRYYGRS